MSLLAEEFEGVSLLLEGVRVYRGGAVYFEAFGLDFYALSFALRLYEKTLHMDA